MEIHRIVNEYVHGALHFSLGRVPGQQDSAMSLNRSSCKDPGPSEETLLEIISGEDVVQISTAEVLLKLPDHIMTCILLWEEGKPLPIPADMECTPMEYVCHMVRLFVSLCPMFRVMHASLDLFSSDFQMKLIDSVTLLLLLISSEAGRMRMMRAVTDSDDPELLRDVTGLVSVIPSCLQAVLLFMTERDRGLRNVELASEDKVTEFDHEYEIEGILHGLKLHPRGWVFLHAAMESTRVAAHMLVVSLQQKKQSYPLDLLKVAQGVEYSMAVLEWLIADEGMYALYRTYDANAASIARLVCTCMDLVTHGLSIPPFVSVFTTNTFTYEPRQRTLGEYFYPTDCCEGFAERIAARACAMIVSLGYHTPSLYDVLCEKDEESKSLARVMTQGMLGILKQILKRPTTDSYAASPGEGQLAINCLRAVQTLSSNENFKKDITQGDVAILLCSMAPGDFESFWGPGCLAVRYMNVDSCSIDSSAAIAKEAIDQYSSLLEKIDKKLLRDVVAGLPEAPEGQYAAMIERGLKLALERSILLIKFVACLLVDVDIHESKLFKHLLTFVESGVHDYLIRNLNCMCRLAHQCNDGKIIQESEVHVVDTLLETIIRNM